MNNILSYLFANTYSGLGPVGAATCQINGQIVDCPQFLNTLGTAMPLVVLVVAVITIVSMWKIYSKAGQPGWAAIIPFYNVIVMLRIVKKPAWWLLLMLLPFVNIIISIIVSHGLSKAFGKGAGFTLGLIFLPFIFYPILAFGKATFMSNLPTMPIEPLPQTQTN